MRKKAVFIYLILALNAFLFTFSPLRAAPSPALVRDVFGRVLNGEQISLVDWEGQLANPAIQFSIAPPADATFPATVTVSANGSRIYFDILGSGSTVSPTGPTKLFSFSNATPQNLFVSIFPDHDAVNETYTFTVQVDDLNGTSTVNIPVLVLDQDQNRPLDFHITLDFSQDQSGFFNVGSQQRIIAQQVADDWAYFIADMNLDTVGIGQEFTYIWNYPDAFHIPGNGDFHLNTVEYNGFLAYFYGITCTVPTVCPDANTVRSGGAPTGGGTPQSSNNGVPLSPRLWRSGDINIETQGNYNLNGWFLSTSDDDWQNSDNLSLSVPDLNSIAHHELGHAIAFNNQYPAFVNGSVLTSPAIVAYRGSSVPIDGFDHFDGIVDRQSKYGIFGNEYNGNFMPNYRWLITKLDVLLMQAVGYKIRQTSAFVPLEIKTTALPVALPNLPYQASLISTGGLPTYNWTISAGTLPPGLTLDSFTGDISGTPTKSGTFPITVRLCDNDSLNTPGTPCKTKALSLVVASDLIPGRNYFTTHDISLTWNPIAWATGYEIQVDESSSFSVPEYKNDTLTVEQLADNISDLSNGIWYWRIRARKADGTWGLWSAVESFTVYAP